MFTSIIIFLVRRIKKIILYFDTLEVSESLKSEFTNLGCMLLPEAKIINMQKLPQMIVLGKGSYVRAELLIFRHGGKIKIGENCYVGAGTRIWSGEEIFIGNNVLISHDVNIMDTNAHEIDHLERAKSYMDMITNGHPKENTSVKISPIYIDDYVWINFNVTILKGVKIGKGAIIASDTVVLKDVPPFVLVGGNPAKILKHLD